jgi:hypothetical protein
MLPSSENVGAKSYRSKRFPENKTSRLDPINGGLLVQFSVYITRHPLPTTLYTSGFADLLRFAFRRFGILRHLLPVHREAMHMEFDFSVLNTPIRVYGFSANWAQNNLFGHELCPSASFADYYNGRDFFWRKQSCVSGEAASPKAT